MAVNLEDAAILYEEATALVKKVFDQAGRNQLIDGREISSLVWRLVEHTTLGDRGLVYFTNRATPQNLLVSQSVNTCILALVIGMGLRYDTAELNQLGAAALLHNIGMVRHLETIGLPRKLTPRELDAVRQHPVDGEEILKKVGEIEPAVLFVCRHQYRKSWEGVTVAPHQTRWQEYTQIVRLVDIYVAMTQPRPYREPKLSHEAVRELIGESHDIFSTRIMKTLIDQIGIYPIGSWVRLNTDEIARVVEPNRNFPLHPVVEVLFDNRGESVDSPKQYNLYQQRMIYIKEPVDYQKLNLFGSN